MRSSETLRDKNNPSTSSSNIGGCKPGDIPWTNRVQIRSQRIRAPTQKKTFKKASSMLNPPHKTPSCPRRPTSTAKLRSSPTKSPQKSWRKQKIPDDRIEKKSNPNSRATNLSGPRNTVEEITMGKNQTTPKSTVLGSIYNWSIPELSIVSDAEGCRRRSETEGIGLGLKIAALLSCSTGTGIRDVSKLSAALSGGGLQLLQKLYLEKLHLLP